MEPRVGASRPLIRLKSVDLPAPLGPMIAWRSPRAIASVTPRMIAVAPKLLWTPASSSAFSAMGSSARGTPRFVHVPPAHAQQQGPGDHQQRGAQPWPWPRRVHGDPEELHDGARLGLRRTPVRDLDERDGAHGGGERGKRGDGIRPEDRSDG